MIITEEILKGLPAATLPETGKLHLAELMNAVVVIPAEPTNAATAAVPEELIRLLPVSRRPLKEEWKDVKAMVAAEAGNQAEAAGHQVDLLKDRAAVEEDHPADNEQYSFSLTNITAGCSNAPAVLFVIYCTV